MRLPNVFILGRAHDFPQRLRWQAFEKNHSPMSPAHLQQLTGARSSLKTRVKKHNKLALELLGPRPVDPSKPGGDILFESGVRLSNFMKPGEWETHSSRQARQPSTRQPEFYGIDLPSTRPMPLRTAQLARAASYEIVLLSAHMDGDLHDTCLGLVDQAETYRRTIKRTPGNARLSQREKVQVNLNTKEQSRSVRLLAQQYNVFRERMGRIEVHEDFFGLEEFTGEAVYQRKTRFQELSADHIRCDLSAYDTLSVVGFQLPWFWKINARDASISDEDFVQDCTSLDASIRHHRLTLWTVFRVRWINARATVDRCDEEGGFLHAEMGMVYRGYRDMAQRWGKRAELLEGRDGYEPHVSTARADEEIWNEFADRARHEFNLLVPGIIP